MKYRKLENTDLLFPEITSGAWAAGSWMWSNSERKGVINAIRILYSLGLTSVNAALIYSQVFSSGILNVL